MVTYQVQYRKNDEWAGFTADDGSAIDFANEESATSMAKRLCKNFRGLPLWLKQYRVVSSDGQCIYFDK